MKDDLDARDILETLSTLVDEHEAEHGPSAFSDRLNDVYLRLESLLLNHSVVSL